MRECDKGIENLEERDRDLEAADRAPLTGTIASAVTTATTGTTTTVAVGTYYHHCYGGSFYQQRSRVTVITTDRFKRCASDALDPNVFRLTSFRYAYISSSVRHGI